MPVEGQSDITANPLQGSLLLGSVSGLLYLSSFHSICLQFN
jgi:hypothetical protein